MTDELHWSIPMGRYGRVEEIARTAAFLCSAGAGYTIGRNLRVDGGLTRSVRASTLDPKGASAAVANATMSPAPRIDLL